MGAPGAPPQATLICALTHRPGADAASILGRLAMLYGPTRARSDTFAFEGTSYYEPEMGPGLEKFLVSFERTVAHGFLTAAKLAANALELETADGDGKRVFNLDPGLVTLHNVVLATTKGYSHRIYVADGIWEEVTLLWNAGRYEPLAWTYPDFRRDDVLRFLGGVRNDLKKHPRRGCYSEGQR